MCVFVCVCVCVCVCVREREREREVGECEFVFEDIGQGGTDTFLYAMYTIYKEQAT